MKRRKSLFIILGLLLTPVIIYVLIFAVWLIRTDILVREKFEAKLFASPTQFYSNSLELTPNQTLPEAVFLDLLKKNEYRQKNWGSPLQPSDYSLTRGEECEKIYSASFKCYAFHHHEKKKINIIGVDETDRILVLLETDPENGSSKSLTSLILFPQLFAQYLGSTPVIQQHVDLSQVPRSCLDAVRAVEDPHFLEHGGVSYRGLLRALWVNLKSGRSLQGGSTITQQLVKNYFLTPEKLYIRKLKEMMMSFVVEARISKDQILETYLNIIYLGQQGNFQVRGYHAAARFYFNKDIESLQLHECALLGAIVNSPGRYNPFSKKDAALQRRTRVLNAMLEQNLILPEDFAASKDQPLPVKNLIEIKETAPYFIDAVTKTLRAEGYNDLSGFKIFTTLDLLAQANAQKAVQTHLNQLESSSAYHQENKKHSLQGVLVAADPRNGDVLALVGGRDHRFTPYNRVLESHRQVGSIFKPIVFLTAFHELPEFAPMTLLDNSHFIHKEGKNVWEPKNYDGLFTDPVPAYYALKESLNIPTARLALDVGLKKVIGVAKDLGVESTMKPFPALSLGAFEMTPFEVLRVYTTIARFGSKISPRLIKRVEDMEGGSVYTPSPTEPEQVLEPGDFVNLVSIMQETMKTGTGQSTQWRGFTQESAGKTGTTSNYKDAWFAGFTANHIAVVWAGYDDNTPIQLSGSSGALPIWVDYMKTMAPLLEPIPLAWPQVSTQTISVSPEDLLALGIPENKALPAQILYYKH